MPIDPRITSRQPHPAPVQLWDRVVHVIAAFLTSGCIMLLAKVHEGHSSFVAFLWTKRTTVVLLMLVVAFLAALYGGLSNLYSGEAFRYDIGITLFMLYLGQLLIVLFLWFRLGPIAWLLMFAQFVIGALAMTVARSGGWVVY